MSVNSIWDANDTYIFHLFLIVNLCYISEHFGWLLLGQKKKKKVDLPFGVQKLGRSVGFFFFFFLNTLLFRMSWIIIILFIHSILTIIFTMLSWDKYFVPPSWRSFITYCKICSYFYVMNVNKFYRRSWVQSGLILTIEGTETETGNQRQW